MGRLFWKFFIFFWLAQFSTVLGVGTAIWLARDNHMPGPPVPPPPNVTGELNIEPPARLSAAMPLPLRPPLIPLFAGSIVSLCFAGVLAWYFARPIRSLRSAFRALANGQLSVRLGDTLSHRRDELSDLGVDFDRMAEQLGNLIEGQRRLLHDVSHELRSPLARLQAAADLMEQQPDRNKEFVARIHRDTARMDNLVGELLALARLDGGVPENMSEAVEIAEALAEVSDRTQLEIEQKHCQLGMYVASPMVILANRELLNRALENIVRNAVRYSPHGGRISILAIHNDENQQAVIEITDEGPGVHEAELEAIFTPFTHTNKSDWSSGFGLGLSITRRIVVAHGGTVIANNRSEGGLHIVMQLPLHNE